MCVCNELAAGARGVFSGFRTASLERLLLNIFSIRFQELLAGAGWRLLCGQFGKSCAHHTTHRSLAGDLKALVFHHRAPHRLAGDLFAEEKHIERTDIIHTHTQRTGRLFRSYNLSFKQNNGANMMRNLVIRFDDGHVRTMSRRPRARLCRCLLLITG